jgi:hypothetical protein
VVDWFYDACINGNLLISDRPGFTALPHGAAFDRVTWHSRLLALSGSRVFEVG